MYSRAYTEGEILDVFTSLGLKKLQIYRETQNSKEFGTEYMMVFVFQKIG